MEWTGLPAASQKTPPCPGRCKMWEVDQVWEQQRRQKGGCAGLIEQLGRATSRLARFDGSGRLKQRGLGSRTPAHGLGWIEAGEWCRGVRAGLLVTRTDASERGECMVQGHVLAACMQQQAVLQA